MDTTASPIAENIRHARERRGLTQLALAHLIGYKGDDAGAYICRLEGGQQEPRVKTLQRIARALRTTVGELLEKRK